MDCIQYNEATQEAIIHLNESNSESAKVWKLDQLGSIVERIFLFDKISKIDCSSWPMGTWFLKVETLRGVQLKKIIINHKIH
jgi:hypothetical protein